MNRYLTLARFRQKGKLPDLGGGGEGGYSILENTNSKLTGAKMILKVREYHNLKIIKLLS